MDETELTVIRPEHPPRNQPSQLIIEEEVDLQFTERSEGGLATDRSFVTEPSIDETVRRELDWKAEEWVFGIYLRYLVTPRITFVHTLCLILLLDTLALVNSLLLLVPLFNTRTVGVAVMEAPRSEHLDLPLILNILHLLFRAIVVKLSADMLVFQQYRKYAAATHVFRIILFGVQILQGIWYRDDISEDELLHSVVHLFFLFWAL